MLPSNRIIIATPIPYEDESAGSLLLRASCKNGLLKPFQLASRYYQDSADSPRPAKFRSLLTNESYFRILCKSLCIDEYMIEPLAPVRTGATFGADFIFCNLKVHRDAIRVDNPAICPLCISECGYMKRSWDHLFVTACSKHDVKLLTSCPDCLSPISWNRKNLNQCDCGYDYTNSKLISTDSSVSQVMESIFQNNDQNRYEILLDYLTALKSYYRASTIFDDDLLTLALLGLTDPTKLEELLFNEIMIELSSTHYHPRTVMADFFISATPEVRQLGENIVDKMFDAGASIRPVLNKSDCLSIEAAAVTLGISRSDVLSLNREKMLFGYKTKPSTPWRITKKSINDLFFKIDSLSQASANKNLVTLNEIVSSSTSTTISKQIIQIVKGNLTPVDFNYKDNLSTIKVIKPTKPQLPATKKLALVKPIDLAEFCGAPLNTIRLNCQSGNKLKYFDGLATKGGQKYITQKDAMDFAAHYYHKIRNKEKRSLMMNRSASQLKTTVVEVFVSSNFLDHTNVSNIRT